MNFLTHFFLSVSFVLTLAACRASFEDIQKPNLVSSGDDLGAKDANVKPAGTDEAPILESTQELPKEESSAYDCDGIVVIHNKGRDRNRDGVLQPTEISEITTECRKTPKDTTDAGGKGGPSNGTDSGNSSGKDPGKPTTPPSNCPNQNPNDKKCPDSKDQNNPGQSLGY